MEMLKAWVRDLAILAIFASLIEMLLPNGSLKKYVKLVIGFFILLAVLNPILGFLNADYRTFYPFETSPAKRDQQKIQKDGQRLQEQNQQLAVSAYQTQLEEQIRAWILTQGDVEDAKVQVTAKGDGQIQSVQVGLQLTKEVQAAATTTKVPPVEKVEIAIGIAQPKEHEQVAEATAETAKMRQIQDKVVKLLGSLYNLKPEAISFQ